MRRKSTEIAALSVCNSTEYYRVDRGAEYPSYCDIAVSTITAADRVDIAIAPNSMATAIACGLCPTNQTLAGKIRVWARTVPDAAISAEYWLNQGKE